VVLRGYQIKESYCVSSYNLRRKEIFSSMIVTWLGPADGRVRN
jgi:hypothetical protein